MCATTASHSIFTIKALEDTDVLEYNFMEFKKLVAIYPDIAAFYIRYMEQHWIIEKEPYEVSLWYELAKTNYDNFLRKYPPIPASPPRSSAGYFLQISKDFKILSIASIKQGSNAFGKLLLNVPDLTFIKIPA
jgi:hypothetical protein